MVQFELIVPAFNEAENIESFIQRTAQAANTRHLAASDFQLVIVDNGSQDDTQGVLARLKGTELGNWFRVVRISKNIGYGDGIWKGLTTTSAPTVGWTHCDHQCDPLDAFRAFRTLSGSPQKTLVKGHREGRTSKERFVTHVFEGIANSVLKLGTEEINAQPKVFHRDLLALLTSPPIDFAFDLYVLYQAHKAGYQITSVPVQSAPRLHGASKWASHFLSRYRTMLKMVRYIVSLRFT